MCGNLKKNTHDLKSDLECSVLFASGMCIDLLLL